ncbi:MAG: hypothetical protein VB100_14225 [Angelakisella sp.]|nr:hypothetical protein [Angelakisella sp.]
MIGRDETSGKPRGEAQGCTTISVGRKAAGKGTAFLPYPCQMGCWGVPGRTTLQSHRGARSSALYRHDSRTIKCPPLLVGDGHFGGWGNRCRNQLSPMRTAAAGSTLA